MSDNFPGSQDSVPAQGVRLISGHQGTNSGTATPPPHAKKEYVKLFMWSYS